MLDFNENTIPSMLNDESIEKLNKALFEFHVTKGELDCSECKRIYKINNSIPNMLINE